MTTEYCSQNRDNSQRFNAPKSAKNSRHGLSIFERHGELVVKRLANGAVDRFASHDVVLCNVLILSNPLANVEELLQMVQRRVSVASRILTGAEILRPEERPVIFACPDVKFFKRRNTVTRRNTATPNERVRSGLHWNVAFMLHTRALAHDPTHTRTSALIEQVCATLPDGLGASFGPLRFRRENATVSQMAAYSRNHCYDRHGYLVESYEDAEAAAQLFAQDWLIIAPPGV